MAKSPIGGPSDEFVVEWLCNASLMEIDDLAKALREKGIVMEVTVGSVEFAMASHIKVSGSPVPRLE
jgi:hypothetical protein